MKSINKAIRIVMDKLDIVKSNRALGTKYFGPVEDMIGDIDDAVINTAVFDKIKDGKRYKEFKIDLATNKKRGVA